MSENIILYNKQERVFTLQLASSYYALRVRDDGAVIHVGSGPCRSGAFSKNGLSGLNLYKETSYQWEQQATPYELPAFGQVTYHDSAIKLSFPKAPGNVQHGDASNIPIRDFRPVYRSHAILKNATPGLSTKHGQPVLNLKSRPTLAIKLRDQAYPLTMTLYYRITPEYDIIERWVELKNESDMQVHVEAMAFATLHLPNGHYEVTRPGGNWGREFAMTRHALPQHKIVVDQKGLNTGHHANPFFVITETGETADHAGTAWAGALAYSGNWQFVFERLGTGPVRIHGGYEQGDFSLTLPPGASHATPAFIIGISGTGMEGASHRLSGFIRTCILPSSADRTLRPVLYNSWEATYFDVSLENQTRLARIAASIGVELFCVDDGWFGGRTSETAGLGDWTPRSAVFPHGLKPLSNEVHSLGMKFGIWIEPEMINQDSDLYRAHPDWVLHYPGRPRTLFRHQLILDLGRHEVVEYLHKSLRGLVLKNGIDFIKWDMNRYVTEAGSVAGKAIWQRHIEALYHLMDSLRSEFPQLDFETCSGGGGRIDPGILARSDQAWTSDNTDAIDRISIQEGFSHAYPSRAMECWVTHEVNHQTGRRIPLDFRFDVAMRGALGIGTSIDQLSEDELTIYRRKIAFYKKLRPTIQTGDLYRLRLLARDGWSVWLHVAEDKKTAVYSTIIPGQQPGFNFAPPKLRGLNEHAKYSITDENGAEFAVFSGAQLMYLGMPGDARFGGFQCSQRSRTLFFEAKV